MLVGRAGELALLRGQVARGETAALLGEAGIGKTALLRSVGSEVAPRTFEAPALASLGFSAYLPLAQAIGRPPSGGDPLAIANDVARVVGAGLLFLDDLQWADRETRELLPLLSQRVRLAVAVRSGDQGTDEALAALAASGAALVELGPLPEADARRLLEIRHPLLNADKVGQLLESAGGNPLLLEELAANGSAPGTLLRSLRVRLQDCSPAARETMALLGLLARPAERRLIGDAVDELLAARLVIERGGYAPRHALLGEAVAAELDPRERRRLHARLGCAVTDPGEAARHHQAAADAAAAHECAIRAAASAAAPGERARHLHIAAACAPSSDAGALRVEAARSLIEAGAFAEAETLLVELESDDPLARAETHLLRARLRSASSDYAEARTEADRGLALVEGSGSPTEVELTLEQARLRAYAFDADAAVEIARRALALALVIGACEAQARCMVAQALYLGGSRTCHAEFRRAMALARERHDFATELSAGSWLVAAEQFRGRSADALRSAARLQQRAAELGLRGWELRLRFLRARTALYAQADFAWAIPELAFVAEDPALGDEQDHARLDLALGLADSGRETAAREVIDAAVDPTASPARHLLRHAIEAEVEWVAGRPDRALAAAETGLECGPSIYDPTLVVTRAWAHYDLGRIPSTLTPRISPPPLVRGGYVEAAAIRSLSLPGGGRAAAERFAKAARLWHGNVAREELRCLWGWGEALRVAGDVPQSRRRLLDAEKLADELGFLPLLARIRRSLRCLGEQRPAPARHTSAGISARELEILALVRAGLTSREIALRLGVTAGTVNSEIRSARLKLGAATRRQAALLAESNGSEPRPAFRPLMIVEGPTASLVERFRAGGWTLNDGFLLPHGVWNVSPLRLLCTGTLRDEAAARAALLAAVRGAGLLVRNGDDPALTARFADDLRHLGRVEHRQAGETAGSPHLTAEQETLLALLAEGRSLKAAATMMHLSPRTAHRRLHDARAVLGVDTTAEAIAAASCSRVALDGTG